MNYAAFSTHELGGKSSPFLLSVEEWRAFSNYINQCVSLPTNIDSIIDAINRVKNGTLKQSLFDLRNRGSSYTRVLTTSIEMTTKVKEASLFWGAGGRVGIISLAQNIVRYADLICIKHYADLNQVLLEAQKGHLSPNTKSKFINICKDLSEHALRYHLESQTMLTYISGFYTVIRGCKDTHQNCQDTLFRVPMYNNREYEVIAHTDIYLLRSIRNVIPSEAYILPVIRKIHLIWSAISYDLKELGADLNEDLVSLPAIIAALELELAFENWSAIRQKAEDFYKNAENFS
ncbi:hypothetical protein [Bacillus wiedmannii]|uniref:hypothetical protein n=1 Tax=Bacillus wiedmannii TaxID=1890302 RepID=UPI000B434654|nr:hypothetical protein BK740_17545 [Bacillus thuringiensis serovar argentinensis]